MAEEFVHGGICGAGTWWNSSKTMFTAGCSSPCSTGIAADVGSGFGWGSTTDHHHQHNHNHMGDMKGRCCDQDQSANNSVSDNSIVFQSTTAAAHQKPHQQADSDSGGGSILIDSTLQMMGFGLSSSTTSDWNQSLLQSNGRNESYNSILQEDINSSRSNCREEIQKEWSPAEDSDSITNFKPMNQDFSLNSVTSCSGNSTTLSSPGFPMASSASYGYPSTVLLQSLFEPDPQPQPHHHHHHQQQPLFNNRSINYMSATAASSYGANANELSSPSWPKLAPFLKPAASSTSLPKQQQQPQQQPTGLHFSNNTAFWNASATGLNDVKASFLPSPQSQFLAQTFQEKPKNNNTEQVRDSGSVMKKGSGHEPPFKRPRIETPSPLPTFKVRKEKLGDRITALQQLVSPFGKTDTASVLHEAIEYIKFLHDQVNVLSTPYLKQAAAPIQPQQSSDKLKEADQGAKQDLRSRGLCLVPISSTFPVANETTADFWTPTFGGTFR